MTRSTCLLLAALFSPVSMATTVDGFLADPVALLDVQGKALGQLALKDAPKQPLQVLDQNDKLELVQVELNGRKVWLDTMDLRLSDGKIVTTPCADLSQSQKQDARNASTIGFGSTCTP
jgi:hypothetical protein